MARGRSSFVNVYLYIRQIIYIQRTKSIPFSEILCMIFATCISGVQNDRFVGQRILMFCNVLGLSSKFIFLILLLNTIQNGLCIKIFLFFFFNFDCGIIYQKKKKKMKKLRIMFIDNIIQVVPIRSKLAKRFWIERFHYIEMRACAPNIGS